VFDPLNRSFPFRIDRWGSYQTGKQSPAFLPNEAQ
jgi:hypothetical protein